MTEENIEHPIWWNAIEWCQKSEDGKVLSIEERGAPYVYLCREGSSVRISFALHKNWKAVKERKQVGTLEGCQDRWDLDLFNPYHFVQYWEMLAF